LTKIPSPVLSGAPLPAVRFSFSLLQRFLLFGKLTLFFIFEKRYFYIEKREFGIYIYTAVC
jgi:hypothetical protein